MSRAEYIGVFDANEIGIKIDERLSLIVERDGDNPRFVTCNDLEDTDTLYVKRRGGECSVDVDFFDNCPYIADFPAIAELIA
jgi:hypothetical protein